MTYYADSLCTGMVSLQDAQQLCNVASIENIAPVIGASAGCLLVLMMLLMKPKEEDKKMIILIMLFNLFCLGCQVYLAYY